MKATHKITEEKTNRQLANMALKAMSNLQGYSNGTISNPVELASHVMPDKRTLIQTIYEDGYLMYNDGFHIVEIDNNTLYVDLTEHGMRECQITKMEMDTDFEYRDEQILNEPEIKYQSKNTNTMETNLEHQKEVIIQFKDDVFATLKQLYPKVDEFEVILQYPASQETPIELVGFIESFAWFEETEEEKSLGVKKEYYIADSFDGSTWQVMRETARELCSDYNGKIVTPQEKVESETMKYMIDTVTARGSEMLKNEEVVAVYNEKRNTTSKKEADDWLLKTAVATLILPVNERGSKEEIKNREIKDNETESQRNAVFNYLCFSGGIRTVYEHFEVPKVMTEDFEEKFKSILDKYQEELDGYHGQTSQSLNKMTNVVNNCIIELENFIMETTVKSVSKAIKELVMMGKKNLVPFGNSIGIKDQNWINLNIILKKILQENEKNSKEAKKILSEQINTKNEEIAQKKKIKGLDNKFNTFVDSCSSELLQLCKNEEKQIPIAVYNFKNVINSHLLSENGKYEKILQHIGDIKNDSVINKREFDKKIYASSIIYNELSEHVFSGIKTRTEAEHSLNNALNGCAYDIIEMCEIKDISLYLRQKDFSASINADRSTYRIDGQDVVVAWNKNRVMINDTASKGVIADDVLQRLKSLGEIDYSIQDNYGLASRKFKTQRDAFNAFAELRGKLYVMEYYSQKTNVSSFSTNGDYEESLKWSADIRFTSTEAVDFASLSDVDRNEIADVLVKGYQHGTLTSAGIEWDAYFDIEVIDEPGDYRYFESIPLNVVEEIAESIRNGNLSGEVEVSVIQLGSFSEEEISDQNLKTSEDNIAIETNVDATPQFKKEEVIIGDTKLDSKQLLELLQKRKLTVESVIVNGRKGTAVLKMDENNKIKKQFYTQKPKQNLDAEMKSKTSKSTKTLSTKKNAGVKFQKR
jgi:hypothetical protein